MTAETPSMGQLWYDAGEALPPTAGNGTWNCSSSTAT